jgi:hypothetical protein
MSARSNEVNDMAGNPRENIKDRGFWDGGAPGNSSNGQTAGRASGFPGSRKPRQSGIKSDLEFPEQSTSRPVDESSSKH